MDGFALKIQMAKGWPDRLVLMPGGGAAFIELKRPKGGRLSLLQEKRIHDLRQMGFYVMVISTGQTLDKAIELMSRAEYERQLESSHSTFNKLFPIGIPDDIRAGMNEMLKEKGK